MLRVKYPNSHGLDGMVHTMEINKAYSLNNSDDSILLFCGENGKDVIVHLVKKDGKWKMLPHTNEEYEHLPLSNKSITRRIKLELDGLDITNVDEEDYDFSITETRDTPVDYEERYEKNITVYVYQDHKYIDFDEAVSLGFVVDSEKNKRVLADNLFLNNGIPSYLYEINIDNLNLLNSKYNVYNVELNTRIKRIVTNKEGTGAEVIYCDGKTVVINDELELTKIIERFARQEQVKTSDLYRAKKIVKKEEEKNLIPTTEESDNKSNSSQQVGDANDNKKNAKKTIVTLTSLATAAVIGFLSHGYFLRKDNDSKNNNEFKTYTITTQVPIVTTPEPIIMATPVITDRLTEIVGRLYNGERVNEDDLTFALKNISEKCYINMPGVYDLINGKRMTGHIEKLDFSNMFPEDSFEHFILKGYCLSREDMINNAQLQRRDTTKADLKNYLDEICNFTFNGATVDYRGNLMNFYSLSPIARYIVAHLGMQATFVDKNYSTKINGRNCGYNELSDAYTELVETLAERLENNSMRK